MNQKDMSGMINFCKFMNSCLMSEAPSVAAFQIVLPQKDLFSVNLHVACQLELKLLFWLEV